MDLVAVGADLRNDPGHGDEDADVDLRGREDEAGPPLPSPGPRLAPAAPPAPRHPVASPDKRQPRPGAFARGPEAALGCVCASEERAQHVAAAPWGAAPWGAVPAHRSRWHPGGRRACLLWTRTPIEAKGRQCPRRTRPALSSCRSQTWGPAEATAQRTSPSAPCPLLAGDLFPLGSVLLGGGLGGPGRGPAGVSHCSEGWDPRFQTVRRSSENSFV